MTNIVAISVMLLAQVAHTQEQKQLYVDHVCGRVERVEKVPTHEATGSSPWLSDLDLELYESKDGTPCCVGSKMVHKTRSGRDGSFNFKHAKPGRYWLSTRWNEKEYNLAFIYRPKKDFQTVCTTQGIALHDDGSATWWKTISIE